MDYVRLGTSGVPVSRVCLGTMSHGSSAWRPRVLDADREIPFTRTARERGINCRGTADMDADGASEEPCAPHPVLGHRSA